MSKRSWDNDYKGSWVPNGHGSLFRAMDEDARIIAQCEANKLLWIAEANKQKALANNTNLNAPIIPPLPVSNNPVPNNPPMTELEKALAEIKALKEAHAAKDAIIADMVSREEVEQIISVNRENIQKINEESSAKDSVIAEQAKENTELRSELHHTDDKLKTITEHNHELRQDKMELREQVKEHKDLVQEWKFMVKEKNEISQKLAEDLTTKNEKIAQLEQQLVQLHLMHSSNQSHESWENIEENVVIPEILGDININYS